MDPIMPREVDDSVDRPRSNAEAVRAMLLGHSLTLLAGVLTNEATVHPGATGLVHSGDPTEVALLTAATDAGFVPDQVRDAFPAVTETPFEPELRYSASLRRVAGRSRHRRSLQRCARRRAAA